MAGDPAQRAAQRVTVGAVLRRVPFTTAVVLVMVVLGVAFGTLWTPIEQLPIYPNVAFGLPAFEAGRWQTIGFGAFFALIPVYYLFVAGGFALLVGFAEWRLGTGRTALITVGGHLIGVLGCALFLLIFRDVGWPWAARVATQTDVGFSAGMMAAACVASMTVAAPWGLRIRLAAIGYVGFSLLYVGLMADIEHGLSVLVSLLLARRLAGPHAVVQSRATAAEWRLLVTIGYGLAVLGALVMRLFPTDGPFGSTAAGNTAAIVLRLALLVAGAAICVGLWRGSRIGWAAAMGLAVGQLLWSGLVVFRAVAEDHANQLPTALSAATPVSSADQATALAAAPLTGLLADAPLAVADGVVMAVLAIALVRGRSAFGVGRSSSTRAG